MTTSQKQRHYLLAAAAAARAAYANESAIAYLEQPLPLVGEDERNGVLLQLAEALEIGGDWAAAEDAVARAAEAAAAVGDADRCGPRPHGASRARRASRAGTPRPRSELTAAEEAFLELGDLAGRGRVLHLRGTLASQQGHPDEARLAYEASLALREEIGDEAGVAAMLTNLALVAEDEGDLAEAERLSQEGLARRRALDDRRAVSVCLMNMGMLATTRGELDDARQRFVEAQALASEVGDPWLDAVGRHNLGNVTRDLGDLAASPAQFDAALDAYVERDDRWSLAHLFEDVALWMLAADADSDADAVVAARCGGGAARGDRGAPLPPDRGGAGRRPGAGPGPNRRGSPGACRRRRSGGHTRGDHRRRTPRPGLCRRVLPRLRGPCLTRASL